MGRRGGLGHYNERMPAVKPYVSVSLMFGLVANSIQASYRARISLGFLTHDVRCDQSFFMMARCPMCAFLASTGLGSY